MQPWQPGFIDDQQPLLNTEVKDLPQVTQLLGAEPKTQVCLTAKSRLIFSLRIYEKLFQPNQKL